MPQCQANTEKGVRCSREASINVDLRKGKNLFKVPYFNISIKTPKYNCCLFCKQHAAVYLSYYSLSGITSFLKSQLSWEEWIVMYPREADKFFNDYTAMSLSAIQSKILEYFRK